MRNGRLAAALTAAAGVVLAPCLLLAAGIALPGTQPSNGSGDPAYPRFMDGTSPGTFDVPAASCFGCHGDYRSTGQRHYEAWDTWAGSMMANAARDPLFWAALDVANQDDAALGNPGVGDFCIRCHVPRAWYEGRSSCVTAWGEEFDGSCLQGSPDVRDNDFEGIFCATCHRMYDASNPRPGQYRDPNAPYAGNAQVYYSTDEKDMQGPFSDAAPPPSRHTFTASAFIRSSKVCGQCHEVTSPAKNRRDPATGTDLGYRMPIERTYSEYLQSRYADAAAPEAATCQKCHMPPPDHEGDGVPDDGYACLIAPGLRGLATTLEGPLHRHVFTGANAWMITVLNALYGDILVRTDSYDTTLTATREMLTQRTLTLSLTAPPAAVAGDVVPVTVRVTNLAGHKFPTGYPEGRRAWVRLVAGEDADADGTLAPSEVQFESGAWDPATGVLAADPQLRQYAAHMGVWNYNGTGNCDLVDDASGAEMFHFVLNDCIVEDSRIPPLGFVPNAETTPVGRTYPPNPALPGTLANWDDVSYNVPIPDTVTTTFLVEARVVHQTATKEYVEFLANESRSTCDPRDSLCNPTQPDPRPNRGEKMLALWEQHGRAAPETLATARGSVSVTPAPTGACCIASSCQDLVPSRCRALEGRFQSAGTSCGGGGCPPPGNPPGEASDERTGATPMTVTRQPATGTLVVSFQPACDATDHAVAWGPLGGVRTHSTTGLDCGFGAGGTASFDPGPGSSWFVVVGRSDAAEGSYGRDSFGVEHPQRVGALPCDLPQDLSATCR